MRFCFVILIILSCFVQASASIFFLGENKLLDIMSRDSIDTIDMTYLLNKVDSIRSSEFSAPSVSAIGILEKYSISEFYCIKAYQLDDGHDTSAPFNVDPYEQVLFNTCDSTLYQFGDCTKRFSALVKNYLPDLTVKSKNKIAELIKLYLNSLDVNDGYFIVSSLDDYKNIWEYMKERRYFMKKVFTDDEINRDIISADQYIRPLEIIDSEGSFITIRVISWELFYGKIESWEFKISDSVFELRYRHLLTSHIGPYIY